MGGMGGSNPFANAFGPDMMARLSAEPKFVPYLADPSFVVKLRMLQQNPNNMQMHLSDPRIMEVRVVRCACCGGHLSQMERMPWRSFMLYGLRGKRETCLREGVQRTSNALLPCGTAHVAGVGQGIRVRS